jgi:hypothetical protein
MATPFCAVLCCAATPACPHRGMFSCLCSSLFHFLCFSAALWCWGLQL